MAWIGKILSYPRAVVATLFAGFYTLFMSVVVVFLAGVVRRRPVVDFAINRMWASVVLGFSGIRVEARGVENMGGSNEGFLLLFNHSSLMDIPALCARIPYSFRFGAKIELFKIPFFGKAMELCGVLPIDRANRNKVMKVYDRAIERVKNGEAFALAPEGTRQKSASLGRFKRGPFEFAVNAQMDIVPVVIAGAYDVLPPTSILINAGKWTRTIIVHVLPRVPTKGISLENVEELLERVRADMNVIYERLNEELKARP